VDPQRQRAADALSTAKHRSTPMTEFSAMALPAFSSLPIIRACAFVPELHSHRAHEGEGERNNVSLLHFPASNPLRYFDDLILRLFSDCKGKGSLIRCVNLCDMALMSEEHLAVLSYLDRGTGNRG
jgi:hypothetical protein